MVSCGCEKLYSDINVPVVLAVVGYLVHYTWVLSSINSKLKSIDSFLKDHNVIRIPSIELRVALLECDVKEIKNASK